MQVDLVDPEEQLLYEIADSRMKRTDVALSYAFAIRQRATDNPDFRKINKAIIERWSMSGLEWIKNRAWKMVGESSDG